LSADNAATAGEDEMTLGAINHIALTVADLARSMAFYQPMLAFLGYRLAMTA
jgi:predicted enzyme related to lactoylglutathione lyase